MNFFRQLWEKIKEIWTGLSRNLKIIVAIGGTALLVAIIVTTVFLARPSYEPLYPSLSFQDTAMISSKLQDMGVNYRIDRDGQTILVPTAQKYQIRLDLANEMPQGGVVGFESFNETRFGETDTDKKIRYLAALQNELTRTIQEMDEVDAAKVHLVLPEESIFISEEKPATASVLLKLKPYSRLEENKIKSIVFFLSHSVEGLSPENVTIIDNMGNLLSESISDQFGEPSDQYLSAQQMGIEKQFEKDLSSSIQTMLERIKGQGKVVVRTSVSMNFDKVEVSSEEFGEKAIRSEQLLEEASEGASSSGSGVPGTETNIPQTDSYQTDQGDNEYSSERKETIRNYEIDKIVENRRNAPGRIEKLSISVVIDGELGEEEKRELEMVVSGAAGLNTERGDFIQITGMNFNTELMDNLNQQLADAEARERLTRIIMLSAPVLLAILLAVGYIIWRRRKASELKRRQEQAMLQTVSEYEEMLELEQQADASSKTEQKIDKIIRAEPESAAKIIRTWLAEDAR